MTIDAKYYYGMLIIGYFHLSTTIKMIFVMIQSFIINSSGGFINNCRQNYVYLVLSLGGLLSCWIVLGGFFVIVGLVDKLTGMEVTFSIQFIASFYLNYHSHPFPSPTSPPHTNQTPPPQTQSNP